MTVLQEAISDVASSLEIEALLQKLAWHAAILVRAELAALVVLDPRRGVSSTSRATSRPGGFSRQDDALRPRLLGVILKEGFRFTWKTSRAIALRRPPPTSADPKPHGRPWPF